MPDMLRNNLQERLLACFDVDPLQDRDSASLSSEEATFEALHFSWYNRHCNQVSDSLLFPYQYVTLLAGPRSTSSSAATYDETRWFG